MTPEQADKIADSILEEPRRKIEAERDKREKGAATLQREREIILPAMTASIAVLVATDYFSSSTVCLFIGTLVGAFIGWLTRRR